MSILKLFRFFRRHSEDLDPLASLMTCAEVDQPPQPQATSAPVPSAPPMPQAVADWARNIVVTIRIDEPEPRPRPSQDRDPRIRPLVDVASVDLWRAPETAKYWARITGTEHYEAECAALFVSSTDKIGLFEAMLVPEENPYDPNAVAVYCLRRGQVGHIPRSASAEWRELIAEMYQLANAVPLCRAQAKRVASYPADDIQIRLELTLPILRSEIKMRRPVAATRHRGDSSRAKLTRDR